MENMQNLFQNGSVWLRADFHLHTIKDKEFQRIENPNDFVSLFVNKLAEEKIHIGVITNHNKFDREEYKSLRKNAIRENIWLLAGTELSVNDGANGIHCLIVFDESKWLVNDEDYINQFLAAAFEGIRNRENENTRCKYSLDILLQKLDEHRKQGRDSFMIFAHVEQNSGFFNELDGGRIEQLTKNELFKISVLGLQKVRTYSKIDIYRQWFGGMLPAFVEGSDCKSITQVGKSCVQNGEKKRTYVKIGDFNFEALKYALIDKEHRVRKDLFNQSNSYVKSICFIGGKLNGQTIHFAPALNTLIGIRGSGKSSVIEILRYALRIPLTNSSTDTSYKNDLVSYILGSGGKVVVTVVDKHNEEFRIEKIYGQKENIYRNATNEYCDCSIGAIFDSPIYFGQKDLSNKKDDFESDLLKRLVGSRLQEISKEIDNKKKEIANIIIEIQKISDIGSLKEDTEKAIKDAEQKLSYFKKQGIEDKLKLQTEFEHDSSILMQGRANLASYIQDITNVISKYEQFFSMQLSSSIGNAHIFEIANTAFGKAINAFGALKQHKTNNESILQEYDVAVQEMHKKKAEMEEDFARIKREINSDTLNPDTFLALTRFIETSKIKLQEIDKLTGLQKTLKNKLLEGLESLNELWLKEYNILNTEVEKINSSNGNLNIEIVFKGMKNSFSDKMKTTFRGTGIRDTTYQNIITEFTDFIEIYRDWEKMSRLIGTNSISAFEEYFAANMADLLTFKVENRVNIKYKGKVLVKHSLGQRASALILFLLAQKDNDVLIIDQPEDDLDNQTIYDEVIKEILKLKGQMQFIFATHNANIPVLGDSEKVISCSFEDSSTINLNMGTIDTSSIQHSIVDVMEGGKDAFNKRKYIYNIWK